MAIHMCECGHAAFNHAAGQGFCYFVTFTKHPTDRKVRPLHKTCNCQQFVPGITLKEHMDKVHS